MKPIDKWLIGLAIILVITSLIFLCLPTLDLAASHLFWNGHAFLFQKNGIGQWFTVYLHAGMRLVFFAYMAVGGLCLATGWLRGWVRWRDYLFIVLSVALAAGLVTNVILKDHWGRARPNQIVEFGGTREFTPAWVITDQCDTNCSFVGGDVSFAFCALAVVLTARRHKPAWIAAVVVFGAITSAGRLASGAHFLSDCMISGLLTSLIIVGLYRLFHDHKNQEWTYDGKSAGT